MPTRAIAETLSALRLIVIDPSSESEDPADDPEFKPGMGLVTISGGSARYGVYSSYPSTVERLRSFGILLKEAYRANSQTIGNMFIPFSRLGEIVGKIGADIEIRFGKKLIFSVSHKNYEKIKSRSTVQGTTTISGKLVRVGSVNNDRCVIRHHPSQKLLYCSVATDKLVDELGQHLNRDVALTGTATWLLATSSITNFQVSSVSPIEQLTLDELTAELRNIGKGWNKLADPFKELEDLRS